MIFCEFEKFFVKYKKKHLQKVVKVCKNAFSARIGII